MPQIISSLSQAVGRGIYIYPKKVIATIKAAGTGRAVMLAQLPWGPVGVETPFINAQNFRDIFAPDGFDRTSDGYLMATKFPWIDLQIVRVVAAAASAATYDFQTAGLVNCLIVNAKYVGAAGNNISATIAAATDANVNHFKLTVSMTDAFGAVTTETYDNVDSTQAAGAYWTTLVTASKLISLVKTGVGLPANATHSLATGSDGTISSADYLGTPGNANFGLAVLESDPSVNFVFHDDTGSGLLAAVEAGMKAHHLLMLDQRIMILHGLPAETSATAKTNAALDIDPQCVYMWGHANGFDDQGTTQNIPLTGPFASFMTGLTPHLSPAYKRSDFTQALSWIQSLDVSTSSKTVKNDLENNGVIAWEKNPDGTFSPYSDIATDGSPIYQTRMQNYLEFTLAAAMQNYRNAPNDDDTIHDERTIIESVLEAHKQNRVRDHIFLPSIVDWSLMPTEATNTAATIGAGDCSLQMQVQLASAQKRLFLIVEAGSTVTVRKP